MAKAIVIIYEVAISNEFGKGGNANEFVKETLIDIEAMATKLAPKRSRTLALSHRNSGTLKSGRYGARGSVVNTAKHAEWVHNGTTGPIFPTGNAFLSLPPGGGHGHKLLRQVRGQKANPWLANAGAAVVARNKFRKYA